MKQYYTDQPELSDGYVALMKERSDEILASLSPRAREIALLLAEDIKRNQ